jgi:uncharacterized membrane protein
MSPAGEANHWMEKSYELKNDAMKKIMTKESWVSHAKTDEIQFCPLGILQGFIRHLRWNSISVILQDKMRKQRSLEELSEVVKVRI